ncbi:MAG: GreA/GreB family elongation factor [Verrucomicrobia bacterium]|nr:GreA/GreB family elongation factor [Verrucomicrobiota bacterium]
MSKAFTRESDDVPDQPVLPRLPSLPPGTKNYLTPDGARRLREELERLVQSARSESPASEDISARRPPSARELRILHLQQSLHTAEVVPPPAAPWEQVRFGATVTVRDRSDAESRYRLVGVDEVDFDRDWVSWLSPIAKALLNARLGQRVRFKSPAGEQELEITGIAYE